MEATDTALRMVPKTIEATDTVMLPPTERAVQSQTDQTSAAQENASQDIASLAYTLWEQRGRPQGSAEQDWNRAEEQIWSEAEDQIRRYRIQTASVSG